MTGAFGTRFGHRLAIACLLATLAGPGFAQFGGGGGGMGGMGGGGGRRGRPSDSTTAPGNSNSGPQNAADKLRDQLYDLRVRLLITTQQAALWDDFSNRVWDLLGRNGLARAPVDGEQNPAELLQARAAEATQKATQWQRLADATTKLYAAMSPEQQQIANQELPKLLPMDR